jgi:circadian clock protein KaiB
MQAIENLKRICETELYKRYKLEVIDITQQPEMVEKTDVIATPTLIKELPKPIRKIIGDLSNVERVHVALNLKPKKK